MGWKGTIRAINAASRAAERDAQRRRRDLERRQKEFVKMQALEQAAYEVEVYENRIDLLLSVHKEHGAVIDWDEIAAAPEPERPIPSNRLEIAAKSKEENYKPGFIDRIFKLENKKRIKLAAEVQRACSQDEENNNKAEKEWGIACDEWKLEMTLAKEILLNSPKAKLDAIKKLSPFADITELGSSVSFTIGTSNIVECTLSTHGSDVVPSEAKSLLSSGRLSVKKIPAGKFNELFQDYVCSCVLRLANELLCILPDDMVIVTATDSLLNKASGHTEELPILSVAISRSTLGRLKLETIDPSDSMSNFVHNMDFKKASGFSAVERVNPDDLVRVTAT
jgi:hypothetical protein